MSQLRFERDGSGGWRALVPFRGRALLNQPLVHKGTAFTPDERRELGIEGLLPHHTSTFDQQARRAYAAISRHDHPLERYLALISLLDRNETLFYRVLSDHIEELMPIVYTPTVGEACRQFSHLFRRGRGIWINPDQTGRIREVLCHAPYDDVRLIVATDNERILGLGDQGAGGMGIPIGKLSLYTMAAGIHPAQTLPISIDVGTDNRELLEDELYVGWRGPRLRGKAYADLIDEVVQAIRHCFPSALLQWEDFKKGNACVLLGRYRHVLPSFNDDIQGTAGVALAAVMAACRAKGASLRDQRVVILGAGAAGIGIAGQLRSAFERSGMRGEELVRAIAVLDSGGFLVEGRGQTDPHKRDFVWSTELAEKHGLGLAGPLGLAEVVRALAPTVLIGTSGEPGAFTEAIVRDMAARHDRPAIFPFSNPTDQSEARPVDLLEWTGGKALIATGSPFDPVQRDGRRVRITQGNNVYVFPGVGLGVLVAEAREVTDSMFTVAAQMLAESASTADLAEGALFPPLTELRDVTRRIAIAVVREARELGVGRPIPDDEIPVAVERTMWEPAYPVLQAI